MTVTTPDYDQVGTLKVSYEDVDLDKIDTGLSYQRRFDEGRAQAIANNWAEPLVNELLLNKVGNKYHCIDGQHTIGAAKIIGKQKLRARVLHKAPHEVEAFLFSKMQEDRKQISRVDNFAARLEYGEPTAVSASDIMRPLGLAIGRKEHMLADGNTLYITSAKAVLEIFDMAPNGEILQKVLVTIVDTWGTKSVKNFNQQFMLGLAKFYVANPKASVKVMIRKLRGYPNVTAVRAVAEEIALEAGTASSGNFAKDYAMALDHIYFKG